MPKRNSPPSYRLHKARNCAVVTIGGKNHYLGPYGSPESKEEYARIIAEEFGSDGRTARVLASGADPTVNELILRYWNEHVLSYYRRNGKLTDRQYHIRAALRPLRKLYGNTFVRDFGPKALQTVREEIIVVGRRSRGGLNRKYVNDHVGIIKRLFRWGVAQELVPLEVHQALETVESIHKGRDPRVKESQQIRPAPEQGVRAVLSVVSPQIRTMIELQVLTGMRPDEVTIMRSCDIDRGHEVWVYVPESHKTAHRDLERIIPLGPKAQQILSPWLDREPTAYLFSPREVYEEKLARRSRDSESVRNLRRRSYPRMPRDHYDDESYCQAVERACKKVEVPKWTPGQLRHNAGTEIRRKYGLEAARLILGHRSAVTTEIYAEKDMIEAIRIMKEMG